MPLNPFKKKPELVYRFIVEDDEAVGLVAIPKERIHDPHWIVSPEGKEISYYHYERKDASESDYDLHLSFETVPIYKVKYRRFQHWFADRVDNFFLIGGFTLLALFLLSLIINIIGLLFESIHDKIIHSIYYQIGFWGLLSCVIFLAIVLTIANTLERRITESLYGKE